jgi:hypothetical protein
MGSIVGLTPKFPFPAAWNGSTRDVLRGERAWIDLPLALAEFEDDGARISELTQRQASA